MTSSTKDDIYSGRPVNLCTHYGNQYRCYKKRLKLELTNETNISLWRIYSKDARSSYHRDTCASMFDAGFFRVHRKWNQPTCPSTEKWTAKNAVHIQIEFSVTKENEIMTFARIILLDKISQIQKNTAHFLYCVDSRFIFTYASFSVCVCVVCVFKIVLK